MQFKLEIGDEVIVSDGGIGVIVDIMGDSPYAYWVASLDCGFMGVFVEAELSLRQPGSSPGIEN